MPIQRLANHMKRPWSARYNDISIVMIQVSSILKGIWKLLNNDGMVNFKMFLTSDWPVVFHLMYPEDKLISYYTWPHVFRYSQASCLQLERKPLKISNKMSNLTRLQSSLTVLWWSYREKKLLKIWNLFRGGNRNRMVQGDNVVKMAEEKNKCLST